MIAHTSNRNAAVVERTHLESAESVNRLPNAYLLFLSPGTRLDNHDELEVLLNAGAPQSIEDLILSCWDRWKTKIATKLQGGFSFGIFDKATNSIFFVRDHFGMCPGYYFVDHARIIVGSSSKLVRSFLSPDLKRDNIMLADYLSGSSREPERTFFTDIKRLLPGHILQIRSQSVTNNPYWSASDVPENVKYSSPKQEFMDRFRKSVLKDYVPEKTAVLLSGGLDSSAIAGTLKSEISEDSTIPCLSLTYHDTEGWNDSEHIARMEKFLGTKTLEFESDLHDPLSDMEHWLTVMDGPYFPPGHSVSFRLFPIMRDLGYTHVLSGHGGDEIVSYGLGRLNELAKAGKWRQLWREARGAAPLLYQRPTQVYYRYLTHINLIRRVQNKVRYTLNKNKKPVSPINDTLSPKLASIQTPCKNSNKPAWGRIDHNDRMLQNETLELPLQATVLEVIALCAEASDLKVSMPFFDLSLAELCLSLPSDWKLRNGKTRYIVRDAMKGNIPDSVRLRQDKFDFSRNFKAGLFKNPDRLLELTDPAHHNLSPFVNKDKLNNLRAKIKSGDLKIENLDAFFLWRVAVLSLWFGIETAWPERPDLQEIVFSGLERKQLAETS